MGYVHGAMTLGITSGGGKNTAIGIGMWLGLYMAFNVWFIIWPNQKRALGIVECEPEVKSKICTNCNACFQEQIPYAVVTNAAINNGFGTKHLY